MSKPNTASAPDYSKFFNMQNMFQAMPQVKMPGFDMQALMDLQQRNAKAFTEASQHAYLTAQEVIRCQGEMLRETMTHSASMMGQAAVAASPEEKLAKQTEITKTVFQKAVDNNKKIADMVTKAQSEASNILAGRMSEALDEMQSVYSKK